MMLDKRFSPLAASLNFLTFALVCCLLLCFCNSKADPREFSSPQRLLKQRNVNSNHRNPTLKTTRNLDKLFEERVKNAVKDHSLREKVAKQDHIMIDISPNLRQVLNEMARKLDHKDSTRGEEPPLPPNQRSSLLEQSSSHSNDGPLRKEIPFAIFDSLLSQVPENEKQKIQENLEEFNANLSRSIYPEWRFKGMLYSPSVRPNLARQIYRQSREPPPLDFTANLTIIKQPYDPPPEQVFFNLFPSSIMAIDETREAFEMDFVSVQMWKDWRLELVPRNSAVDTNDTEAFAQRCLHLVDEIAPEQPGNYFLDFVPGVVLTKKIWQPSCDEYILNSNTLQYRPISNMMLCPDGKVILLQQIMASFNTYLDRRKFPFDEHILRGVFLNLKFPIEEVSPFVNPDLNFSTLDTLPGWVIGDLKLTLKFKFMGNPFFDLANTSTDFGFDLRALYALEQILPFYRNFSTEKAWHLKRSMLRPFTAITFELPVRRVPNYYLITQVFPMVVVTLMGGACYFLAINATEIRLTIVITSILTIMALSNYIGAAIPQVEYLTWLHIILISAYSFLLFCLIHVVTVAKLLHHDFLSINGNNTYISRLEVIEYINMKISCLKDEVGNPDEDQSKSASTLFAATGDGTKDHPMAQKIALNRIRYKKMIDNTPVSHWTPETVALFFDELGQQSCAFGAIDRGIDGRSLMQLDVSGLIQLGADDAIQAAVIKGKLSNYAQFSRGREDELWDAKSCCPWMPCLPNEESHDHKSSSRRQISLRLRHIIVIIDSVMTFLHPIGFFFVLVFTYIFVVVQ